MKVKKSIIAGVLALGLLKFTDISEGLLCTVEANKIKSEVEEASFQFKIGKITESEFEKVIIVNQRKLDDVLI